MSEKSPVKGLTAHFLYTFGVRQSTLEQGSSSGLLSTLKKTITRASSTPVDRILQINVSDNTLKAITEESVKESHKVADISGSVVEGETSKQLLLSLSSGKKLAYDFQTEHDALLFRDLLEQVRSGTYTSISIPRNVLKRGNVQKQESKAQYSEVFAVLIPQKLFLMASKSATYPIMSQSLAEASSTFDELTRCISIKASSTDLVLRGLTDNEAQEWSDSLHESLSGKYSAAALPKLVAQIHRMTSQASSQKATPPASIPGDTSAAKQLSRFQSKPHPAEGLSFDESGGQAGHLLAGDTSPAAGWVPDNPEDFGGQSWSLDPPEAFLPSKWNQNSSGTFTAERWEQENLQADAAAGPMPAPFRRQEWSMQPAQPIQSNSPEKSQATNITAGGGDGSPASNDRMTDRATQRHKGGVLLPKFDGQDTVAAFPRAMSGSMEHPTQAARLQRPSATAQNITSVEDEAEPRTERSPGAAGKGTAARQEANNDSANRNDSPGREQSEVPAARTLPLPTPSRHARQPKLQASAAQVYSDRQDKQGFSNPLFHEEPDQPESSIVGFCQPAVGFPSATAGRAPGGRNGAEEQSVHIQDLYRRAQSPLSQEPAAENAVLYEAVPSPLPDSQDWERGGPARQSLEPGAEGRHKSNTVIDGEPLPHRAENLQEATGRARESGAEDVTCYLSPKVQNSKSEALSDALQSDRDKEGIACEPQKLAGSPLGFGAVSDTQLPTATLNDVIIHLRAVLASIAQFQTSQHLERSEVGCDLGPSSSPSHARKDGSLGDGEEQKTSLGQCQARRRQAGAGLSVHSVKKSVKSVVADLRCDIAKLQGLMEAVLGILTSSSLEVPLRKKSRTSALAELPAAESMLLHTRQTKPMQESETSSNVAKKEERAWEAASTAVDTLPLGEQPQSSKRASVQEAADMDFVPESSKKIAAASTAAALQAEAAVKSIRQAAQQRLIQRGRSEINGCGRHHTAAQDLDQHHKPFSSAIGPQYCMEAGLGRGTLSLLDRSDSSKLWLL